MPCGLRRRGDRLRLGQKLCDFSLHEKIVTALCVGKGAQMLGTNVCLRRRAAQMLGTNAGHKASVPRSIDKGVRGYLLTPLVCACPTERDATYGSVTLLPSQTGARLWHRVASGGATQTGHCCQVSTPLHRSVTLPTPSPRLPCGRGSTMLTPSIAASQTLDPPVWLDTIHCSSLAHNCMAQMQGHHACGTNAG